MKTKIPLEVARLDITIQQLTPGNGKIVSDDSMTGQMFKPSTAASPIQTKA